MSTTARTIDGHEISLHAVDAFTVEIAGIGSARIGGRTFSRRDALAVIALVPKLTSISIGYAVNLAADMARRDPVTVEALRAAIIAEQ